MRDLMNSHSFKAVLGNGAQIAATAHSDSVDVTALNGGNNGLEFAVAVGVVTDGTHTFTVEDSIDGGSTYQTVAAPYLQTPAGQSAVVTSATAAKTILKFGYLGNPNIPTITQSAGYPVTNPNGHLVLVRVTNTVSGSPGTGGYFTVIAHLGYPANEPAV
jgi:hypothetical protein